MQSARSSTTEVDRLDRQPLGLRRYVVILTVAWTIVLVCVGLWWTRHERAAVRTMAANEAQALIRKDQAFRFWAAGHGGVYVPPTEQTPPNPALEFLPDRDIVTTTGKKLTLMNPAYIQRQIMEDFGDLYGIHGRLTSLTPLRAENAPDDWERVALESLERGESEIAEFTQVDGAPFLRVMWPMLVKQECLKCHGHQGYEVGDIRGGVTVAVPMTPLVARANGELLGHALALGLIWLLGIGTLTFGTIHIRRRVRERDRAENALVRERHRLASIIEGTRVGTWEWNVQTGETTTNERWAQILGHTRKGLAPVRDMGRRTLAHPDDLVLAEALLARHFSGELPHFDFEYRMKHRAGHWVWVHDRGHVVSWTDDGKPLMMYGTHSDITERKRLQQELADSHALLQALIEQSPVPMAFAMVKGDLTFNPAFAEHLLIVDDPRFESEVNLFTMERTWRLFDAQGKPLSASERPLARALEGETTEGLEVRVVREDGSERWDIVNAGPIRNDDGEVIAAFLASPDITERKQAAEQSLAVERQELHAQKLKSLGVLAGGIAHDFNNLLTVILGNASLARDQISRLSPARPSIEEIEKATMRAAELAKQMLAYSGKGRFVIERIDLRELVEEMAHLLDASVSKKAMLRCEFAEDLPTFNGDATQIRQVIMNLITNASEGIGDARGVITLSTGLMDCDRAYLDDISDTLGIGPSEPLATGPYVFIEVADTGCGMDVETIEKIFDPFFTTKFTGRGLGLSALLGIVRGHRGAVRVYSEVGKGTIFKILFPVSRAPAESASASDETALDESGWRGAGTILMADDEESICQVTQEMLKGMGFSVLTATDGLDALRVFHEHTGEIVCVLLDLTMPNMDGEETFGELRRIDPELRVVLLSGYNEQDVTQRFVGKGLAGFLQKPFTAAELRRTLMEVTRGTHDGVARMN